MRPTRSQEFPTPALTGFETWWRQAIPQWLQWILCFPCSAIGAVSVALSARASLLFEWGCIIYVVDLVYPAAAFAVFLWLFWSTVPRAKYELCIAMISIRALLLVALTVFTVGKLAGLEAFRDTDALDAKWWFMLVSEVIAMVAGIFTVKAMKDSYDTLRDGIHKPVSE